MTPQEHYEQGEDLLALSEDYDKRSYTNEARTMLAAQAQAHFLAALAAPRPDPAATREALITEGVFK